MSRERELLKRLLENFERPVTGRFGDLFDEVRELLSTPEPTQDEEPVASRLADELHYAQEIIFEGCGYKLISPEDADEIVAELRRLHPAPRPEFVRLSEEEVSQIEASIPPKMDLAEAKKKFARAIEDALKEKNRG